MNDFEAAARGQRAALCGEFIGPILDEMRSSYLTRMADIAAKELNATKRTEAITALAVALKITNNLSDGLNAAIEDGKMGEKSILRAETVERMGKHARRLFDFAPQR